MEETLLESIPNEIDLGKCSISLTSEKIISFANTLPSQITFNIKSKEFNFIPANGSLN